MAITFDENTYYKFRRNKFSERSTDTNTYTYTDTETHKYRCADIVRVVTSSRLPLPPQSHSQSRSPATTGPSAPAAKLAHQLIHNTKAGMLTWGLGGHRGAAHIVKLVGRRVPARRRLSRKRCERVFIFVTQFVIIFSVSVADNRILRLA